MGLTSLNFFIFIAVTFLLYFITKPSKQWIVLLLSSYFFYFFTETWFSVYLFITTLSTYFIAKKIYSIREHYQPDTGKLTRQDKNIIKSHQRKWLVLALVLNFGILGYLKYSVFIFRNINRFLSSINLNFDIPIFRMFLPLGISFYTFQAMGYLIDVYRNKAKPVENFFQFSLFLAYFPQIIQGPIHRFSDLFDQLIAGHIFDYKKFTFGLQLMLFGYFKKIVIADRAKIIVDTIFADTQKYQGLYLIIAVLFYTIQIYGDFSGGMDIITGISEAIGINLVKNFERPYFARSVSEFWKRWHITLGSWMRDYVFYPLSLSKPFSKLSKFSRKKLGPKFGKQIAPSLASMIVFILVGIWHGANWVYVAFGIYHGIIIMSSTILEPLYLKFYEKFNIDPDKFGWKFLQVNRTIAIVVFGRFFSRTAHVGLRECLRLMKNSLTVRNPWILCDGSLYKLGLDRPNFNLLIIAILILTVISLLQEHGVKIRESIAEQNIIFRWIVYYAAIMFVLIFGIYGDGIQVADFIYRGF
ncbi:MBOAT family O-acyltransferase [Helcococcus kunzii]|uniref:MBOAT family protein n=1 Tax=Helcococcus kunzii ATCC 51366 TaxID=883114 RepID=H3NQD3_9FIRM|nr:hypothetical protein HMPREF9709_01544 [Helcococcus kunzii ATCC 51366]